MVVGCVKNKDPVLIVAPLCIPRFDFLRIERRTVLLIADCGK